MPDSLFKQMGGVIKTYIDDAIAGLQAQVTDTYNKTEVDGLLVTKVPYDIASAVVNKPSGSAKVLRFVAARLFSIPTDLVGSKFVAGVPANATAIFSIYKNTTQIGTITFSAGVTNGVVVCTASTFQLGDILLITAPIVQDTKLADITFTIAAQL